MMTKMQNLKTQEQIMEALHNDDITSIEALRLLCKIDPRTNTISRPNNQASMSSKDKIREKLNRFDHLPDDVSEGDIFVYTSVSGYGKSSMDGKDVRVDKVRIDSYDHLQILVFSVDGDGRWVFDESGGDFRHAKLSNPEMYSFEDIDVDLTPMDDLILNDGKKEQIIATLKQAEKSQMLFEDWGLGDTIEYGRGMTMLFYGMPGTGKTWGAAKISECLGRELMPISIAEIQTQEPGGAARNIKQAFRTAGKEGKVLFFDECDSLISSRDDVGMILGGEINTLLTELEKFEGVCIFSTNRVERLDKALERRISLILEFPEPDEPARRAIWDTLIPDKLPLADDVDLDKIAQIPMVGGLIKNTLLQAARTAAAHDRDEVTHNDFVNAAENIHSSSGKMGKSYHNRGRMAAQKMGSSPQMSKTPKMTQEKTTEKERARDVNGRFLPADEN